MSGKRTQHVVVLAGLALPLAGGCDLREIPEGTPAALAGRVSFCENMDGPVEDWCVLNALQTAAIRPDEMPGNTVYELCMTMHDSGARDSCLEYFARLDASMGVDGVCEKILQQRLRESCFLSISERVMRSSYSIQEVAAACAKAGTLESHCLSHLPAQRQTVWLQNGGYATMYNELQTLLQISPAAASLSGLGFATGVAAYGMGQQGGPGICNVYGGSEAGRSCKEAFTMSGQHTQGQVQAPLAPPSANFP